MEQVQGDSSGKEEEQSSLSSSMAQPLSDIEMNNIIEAIISQYKKSNPYDNLLDCVRDYLEVLIQDNNGLIKAFKNIEDLITKGTKKANKQPPSVDELIAFTKENILSIIKKHLDILNYNINADISKMKTSLQTDYNNQQLIEKIREEKNNLLNFALKPLPNMDELTITELIDAVKQLKKSSTEITNLLSTFELPYTNLFDFSKEILNFYIKLYNGQSVSNNETLKNIKDVLIDFKDLIKKQSENVEYKFDNLVEQYFTLIEKITDETVISSYKTTYNLNYTQTQTGGNDFVQEIHHQIFGDIFAFMCELPHDFSGTGMDPYIEIALKSLKLTILQNIPSDKNELVECVQKIFGIKIDESRSGRACLYNMFNRNKYVMQCSDEKCTIYTDLENATSGSYSSKLPTFFGKKRTTLVTDADNKTLTKFPNPDNVFPIRKEEFPNLYFDAGSPGKMSGSEEITDMRVSSLREEINEKNAIEFAQRLYDKNVEDNKLLSDEEKIKKEANATFTARQLLREENEKLQNVAAIYFPKTTEVYGLDEYLYLTITQTEFKKFTINYSINEVEEKIESFKLNSASITDVFSSFKYVLIQIYNIYNESAKLDIYFKNVNSTDKYCDFYELLYQIANDKFFPPVVAVRQPRQTKPSPDLQKIKDAISSDNAYYYIKLLLYILGLKSLGDMVYCSPLLYPNENAFVGKELFIMSSADYSLSFLPLISTSDLSETPFNNRSMLAYVHVCGSDFIIPFGKHNDIVFRLMELFESNNFCNGTIFQIDKYLNALNKETFESERTKIIANIRICGVKGLKASDKTISFINDVESPAFTTYLTDSTNSNVIINSAKPFCEEELEFWKDKLTTLTNDNQTFFLQNYIQELESLNNVSVKINTNIGIEMAAFQIKTQGDGEGGGTIVIKNQNLYYLIIEYLKYSKDPTTYSFSLPTIEKQASQQNQSSILLSAYSSNENQMEQPDIPDEQTSLYAYTGTDSRTDYTDFFNNYNYLTTQEIQIILSILNPLVDVINQNQYSKVNDLARQILYYLRNNVNQRHKIRDIFKGYQFSDKDKKVFSKKEFNTRFSKNLADIIFLNIQNKNNNSTTPMIKNDKGSQGSQGSQGSIDSDAFESDPDSYKDGEKLDFSNSESDNERISDNNTPPTDKKGSSPDSIDLDALRSDSDNSSQGSPINSARDTGRDINSEEKSDSENDALEHATAKKESIPEALATKKILTTINDYISPPDNKIVPLNKTAGTRKHRRKNNNKSIRNRIIKRKTIKRHRKKYKTRMRKNK